MATRKVSLYSNQTTVHELRLHDDDLRQLFELPKRVGKFVKAELINNCVHIEFTTTKNKYSHNNVTTNKRKGF